jgi:hypothetical protein
VHRPYLYQNQPHETRTSSRLIVSIQNISAKFSLISSCTTLSISYKKTTLS